MSNAFTEDYYMRGPEKGLSNYEDYKWMPDLTLALAIHLRRFLRIRDGDHVIDIGCARGYVVKALRMQGVEAWGHDVSTWAIENCDPSVKEFVSTTLDLAPKKYEWALLKDCAEHIPEVELGPLVESLSASVRRGIFFVVPLTAYFGGAYLRDEDNSDATHVIRWPLQNWIQFLMRHAPGFTVEGSYHIPGIKPASDKVDHSCGFFTLKRHTP